MPLSLSLSPSLHLPLEAAPSASIPSLSTPSRQSNLSLSLSHSHKLTRAESAAYLSLSVSLTHTCPQLSRGHSEGSTEGCSSIQGQNTQVDGAGASQEILEHPSVEHSDAGACH